MTFGTIAFKGLDLINPGAPVLSNNKDVVNFKNLNINSNLLKAINEMGFTTPTEIQEKAIPLLTQTSKDFIGQAQTGTGKTAAFAIPLLDKIDFSSPDIQALVLAPTRELAMQVESEIIKIGKYTALKSTCIYGGSSYEKQITAIKKGKPQIVVGTPGRVIDLMNRGVLKFGKATFCVLDEADEMLNMGFFDDVQKILDVFNKKRQLIMFSATMPRPILKLIERSFNEYEMVKIERTTLSNAAIEQKYFVAKTKNFKDVLSRLIDEADDVYAIVFCRTKIETVEVGDALRAKGYSLEVLNGDMGQAERDRAMKKFKEKKVNFMVCTDVAARGIDVTNLTHVFNYGLPQDNESYVHRIGRTGRAGLTGKAYTIITPNMAFAMRKIEKHINDKIELGVLPSVNDLKSKALEKEFENGKLILERIKDKGEDFKTDSSFESFSKEFSSATKDQLLKLLFTWQFKDKIRHYDRLTDIENLPASGRDYDDRAPRRRDSSRRSGSGGGGGNRRRSSASGSGSRDERSASSSRSRRPRTTSSENGAKASGSGAGGRKKFSRPKSNKA